MGWLLELVDSLRKVERCQYCEKFIIWKRRKGLARSITAYETDGKNIHHC